MTELRLKNNETVTNNNIQAKMSILLEIANYKLRLRIETE